MSNAKQILNNLDAAELRQRIENLDKERQALLVLHRAALRLERNGKAATAKQGKAQEGAS